MKTAVHLNVSDLPELLRGFEGIIPIDFEMLSKILPGIDGIGTVSVRVPLRTRIGQVSRDEQVFLAGLCKWLEPRRIFEIGTFDGLTTANLAANAPEDAEIFTLDIPEEGARSPTYFIDGPNMSMVHNPLRRYYTREYFGAAKLTFLEGDSGRFDFSPFHGTIDMVFVDGSHTYDYCMSDTNNAISLLRKGGLLVWHDYDKVRYLPGVTQVLNEIRRSRGYPMYWMSDPRVEGGRTSIVFTFGVDSD